jgi:hypothetical protein
MSRLITAFFRFSLLGVLVFCSCDPLDDALKMFTKQGLTVLEPARDYIALGGIFVVPQGGGTPSYLDPYPDDTKNLPTIGGATPFRAVVMQQSSNKSAGLEATVGTLGGLVSIPAGLKFSNSKQVQLAQIDASGTRYTSQMVAALIKMPMTSSAIQTQLQDGKNRVFIVQELYTGKNLSVKSSDNSSLAAAVEGQASITTCSSSGGTTTGGASKGTTTGSTSGGTTTGGASKGTTTGGTSGGTTTGGASKGTTTGGTSGGTTTGGASKGTTTGGTSGAATPQSGGSNVGVSVGLCWADAATLSFQSDNAIPFAVRLNEVVSGPGNILQVKITNFKLPNQALGAEEVSATALINGSPTLKNLTHQPR